MRIDVDISLRFVLCITASPKVQITSPGRLSGDTVSASVIDFVFTFDSPVDDAWASSVMWSTGSLSATASMAGSGTTFTFTIEITGNRVSGQTISVEVPASITSPPNQASDTAFVLQYDVPVPSVDSECFDGCRGRFPVGKVVVTFPVEVWVYDTDFVLSSTISTSTILSPAVVSTGPAMVWELFVQIGSIPSLGAVVEVAYDPFTSVALCGCRVVVPGCQQPMTLAC